MNCNILKFGLFSVAAVTLMAGCKSGGMQTDRETGVQYRFFKQTDGGNKPAMDDIARAVIVLKTEKDSVIYNSTKTGGDSLGAIRLPLKKMFDGCLEQGIAMMAAGDSAEFKINADSLYMKAFRYAKLPPFVRPGSYMNIDVKLISFQTKQQAQEENRMMMMKRQQEMMQRQAAEPAEIAKYLESIHYSGKPTEDSLFFITRSGGSKKMLKDGDSVTVKYRGTLLDGTMFDSSDKGPGHQSFTFMYTKDMMLIKGWVEALGVMHEGEKATILCPSALAYGARQAGPTIQPFSPLLFDIEIVSIKSNK